MKVSEGVGRGEWVKGGQTDAGRSHVGERGNERCAENVVSAYPLCVNSCAIWSAMDGVNNALQQ